MARTESIEYQISGINNQITDEFGADNDLTVTGGGRGWTARTTVRGIVHSAKGTSKIAAAQNLYDFIKQMKAGNTEGEPQPEPEPESKTERATVDDAFTLLMAIFPDLERGEADDDTTPGPIWVERGGSPFLLTVIPCVGECMSGQSDLCECKCDGANHGLGSRAFVAAWEQANTKADRQAAIRSIRPTVMGAKECLCGCGETTQRRFVPGHDARYHAALKRQQQAAERGVAIDDLPGILKAERAAARKAKRAVERGQASA